MKCPGGVLKVLAVTCVLVLGSCGDDGDEGAPPELRKLLVLSPDHSQTDLLADPSAAMMPVSPLSELRVVFDKLLDGRKIEEVGGSQITPRTDVASLRWLGAPTGAPGIMALTTYSPGGFIGFGPGPWVRIVARPGLPSGATIELNLDREKITDKAGQPFAGVDTHQLRTAPFAAMLNVAMDDKVGQDQELLLTLSNQPGMTFGQNVTVTANGAPVMAEVKPSPASPIELQVLPGGTAWAGGGTFTVTVGPEATDLFGVKIAEPLMVSFQVTPANGGTGVDAGAGGDAASGADAGGADGGSPADASDDGGPGPDGGAPGEVGPDGMAAADAAVH